MKKLRLLVLMLLLVGGLSSASQSVSGLGCGGGDRKCPRQEPRDNGCRCCSDNHCDSGYCSSSGRCRPDPRPE